MKFLARDIGGRYVVGPTNGELRERYELCRRLVAQYFRLHLQLSEAASPVDTTSPGLEEVFAYQALAGWDLSQAERRWIVDKLQSKQR